jgi:hypothetical protein
MKLYLYKTEKKMHFKIFQTSLILLIAQVSVLGIGGGSQGSTTELPHTLTLDEITGAMAFACH